MPAAAHKWDLRTSWDDSRLRPVPGIGGPGYYLFGVSLLYGFCEPRVAESALHVAPVA